jgi:hypothetical protein
MAGITLAQAEASLARWLAADEALATGQSYSISGRSLTRAETLKHIEYWEAKVQKLSRGGLSVRGVTPII